MKLQIIQLSSNSAVVAFAQENLDAGNVKEFRDQIAPWIEENDLLLLDMHRLHFVDSSGLGALLSCLRNLHAKNGQLRLFGVTKPVQSLFELVRMQRIFSIYRDLHEAQEASAQP